MSTFPSDSSNVYHTEAHISWHWFNAAEAKAAALGKKVLRVNCDETNVQRMQQSSRGLIVRRFVRAGPRMTPEEDDARGSWTHLAFICDDASIQPRLPQVIVGNESVLRVQDMKAVERLVPSNVYLVRQKSSWLDKSLFSLALTWLAKATAALNASHQVVLILDCASVHLTPDIWIKSRSLGIDLVFIPRKLTWLLQPCDTHLFRRYKHWLSMYIKDSMAEAGMKKASLLCVVKGMLASVRGVLQTHKWSRAFSENGFGDQQKLVSHRVKKSLSNGSPVTDGLRSWPCTSELLDILPRKKSTVIA